MSVVACVWAAFALGVLVPFTSRQSVAVPAAPSSWPEELMTAALETAHAPPFTGRFVRSVARFVTSDSACVCGGRSLAARAVTVTAAPELACFRKPGPVAERLDRKSTRLNSSHLG